MTELMERYMGPEWETRYDLQQRLRDLQREIVRDEQPHGEMVDDDGRHWPVWCGARCTNETHSAVGYYRSYRTPTREDDEVTRLEFRPLVSGLSHEDALFVAKIYAMWMERDGTSLQELKDLMESLSPAERADMIADMRQMVEVDDPTPDRSLDLEL